MRRGMLEPIRTTLLTYGSASPSGSSSSSSRNGLSSYPGAHLQGSSHQGAPHSHSPASLRSDSQHRQSAPNAPEWPIVDAAAGSTAPRAASAPNQVNEWGSRDGSNSSSSSSTQATLLQNGSRGLKEQKSGGSRSSSRETKRWDEQQDQPGVASSSQLLWVNLAAGSLSGAAAAAATTPFDVVKTRMQTSTHGGRGETRALSPMDVMKQIYAEGGARGLFVGLGPRAVRCAPACAIVVACYELFKSWL